MTQYVTYADRTLAGSMRRERKREGGMVKTACDKPLDSLASIETSQCTVIA